MKNPNHRGLQKPLVILQKKLPCNNRTVLTNTCKNKFFFVCFLLLILFSANEAS